MRMSMRMSMRINGMRKSETELGTDKWLTTLLLPISGNQAYVMWA